MCLCKNICQLLSANQYAKFCSRSYSQLPLFFRGACLTSFLSNVFSIPGIRMRSNACFCDGPEALHLPPERTGHVSNPYRPNMYARNCPALGSAHAHLERPTIRVSFSHLLFGLAAKRLIRQDTSGKQIDWVDFWVAKGGGHLNGHL